MTQPLQKLGTFYYYFNPILRTIFFLFYMLEPATLYLFFPHFKPVTLKQTTEYNSHEG